MFAAGLVCACASSGEGAVSAGSEVKEDEVRRVLALSGFQSVVREIHRGLWHGRMMNSEESLREGFVEWEEGLVSAVGARLSSDELRRLAKWVGTDSIKDIARLCEVVGQAVREQGQHSIVPGVEKGVVSPLSNASGLAEVIVRNEGEARERMFRILIEQRECAARGEIDVDRDGRGEYASGVELCRASALRGGVVLGSSPVACTFDRVVGWYSGLALTSAHAVIRSDGSYEESGYVTVIYLPDGNVPEQWTSVGLDHGQVGALSGTKTIGIDAAERVWCAYSVPIRYGITGRKVYFVNQSGSILECANEGGVDGETGIDSAMAFSGRGAMVEMHEGNRAMNGEVWTVVR